jgi:hypothetical protein
MSIDDPITITSTKGVILSNTTTFTVASDTDYDNRQKQTDVFATTEENTRTDNQLSSFDVFRIVCCWTLLVIGVFGNLLVVVLVIWKRHRKQVRLSVYPRE